MATKTYTQITETNMISFAIGTKVRFNYGAMHGSDDAIVVDYRVTQWGASLVAETEEGEVKHIEGFTTSGIGCYLI